MFEAVLRRLVLAADTVDIVDTDPFGPEAAPRVAGSSAAACVPWLAVHHKQEAQSAVLPVPSVQWYSFLQTQSQRVPPYRNRRL